MVRTAQHEPGAADPPAPALTRPWRLPGLYHSLSARLLVLTVAFVLIAEVCIYVPSIARYRLTFLEERIAAAHLATLSLEAAERMPLPEELERELLRFAGVLSVALRLPDRSQLMLGRLPLIDATYDLRDAGPLTLIGDAFGTLLAGGDRVVRVVGQSPHDRTVLVDICLDETTLWREMVDYSGRILTLSIVISLITALLVFASLQLLIVRPLRRITESVVGFRARPEDPSRDVSDSERGDEIGVVQRELADMQRSLRSALAHKTRLAALGGAVSKINHDLRNILASAMLLSDRLERSDDPAVRDVAPKLVDTMDRAVRLCSATLNFARAELAPPRRRTFRLAALVDEVGAAVLGPEPDGRRWRNEVASELTVNADRDQLFRVLLNLGRNAVEALGDAGLVSVAAWREANAVVIEVADTGAGIPQAARAHLFEPFAGSTRTGGTGLGLPIAREIVRAHGGDLVLAHTGSDGTVFRVRLPR